MDDISFITLRCSECENIDCNYSRKYIPVDSLEGCTRQLSEDDAAKYYHLIDEVAPFMYINTTKEYQSRTYKEIINFLEYTYNCPFGRKLNKYGKVKGL